MMPLLQEEAKLRQEATRAKPGERADQRASLPIGNDAQSRRSSEVAAKALNIGTSSVNRAVKLKKNDPEAFEKVKRGELTVNAAAEGHTDPALLETALSALGLLKLSSSGNPV